MPGDQFGHGMLDLQAGVHLDEEHVLAVGDEFDGAGADIIDRAPPPCARRRRPPRAAPASSVGDGASSITFWCRRCSVHSRSNSDSRLPWLSPIICTSMWRGLSTNFSISMRSSPNAALASRLALTMAAREFGGRTHDPHAAAAAAGRRLDQNRKADLVGGLGQRRRHPGPRRDSPAPAARRPFPSAPWSPTWSPSRSSSRRSDRRTPALHRRRPARIRHSPTGSRSRDERPRRRFARRVDHAFDVEIAVARPRRPEQHGLIGLGDMHRIAIGLGIDRYGAQAHRPRGADHAAGDLAAIGDQQRAKSPVQFGAIHHHILNRPNRVGSIGALAAAERPRPSTSLVSAGSITPSSQSRAVA